jgi:putative transposase
MSRLRRLVLSDRFLFVTCRLSRRRHVLADAEFACLARVIAERRRKHGFLLTAWVFLPDPAAAGHAILFPRHPLTISEAMESIKVGWTLRINARRKESGVLWRARFFDRALRTVREYNEKLEYIHLNPVRAGLASGAEEWPWSSVHDYTGSVQRPVATPSGLCIDRIMLPADERARM